MSARLMTGVVVSDKSSKTIVVRVDHSRRHPLYSKAYKVSNKFAAHDEKGEARIGDSVQIVESRPISKTKSWRLVKVLQRSVGAEEEIREEETAA
jgi:small subunit ribosomal protein S17